LDKFGSGSDGAAADAERARLHLVKAGEPGGSDSKSSARTLEVFEAFAMSRRPMTLTEISRQLAMPLSSCLHIIRTLERRGYLYSLGPRQGYYPTMRMFRNSETVARHDPLLRVLGPHLAALRDETAETIVLAQRVELQAIMLDIYDSPQRIRYSAERGEVRELYSTALGKALLGSLNPNQRARLLDKIDLAAFTATTITDREALERNIDDSEARGWYVSDSENVADLYAVAIHFRFMSDVFALAVGGPYQRMRAAEDRHVAALLGLKTRLQDREFLDLENGTGGGPVAEDSPRSAKTVRR